MEIDYPQEYEKKRYLMELRVVIKNVYGNKLIYPISYNAELLSNLLNKKTFSENDVEILKELGYTFKVITNPDNPEFLKG